LSLVLLTAYFSAFVLFIGAVVFNRNSEGFRFETFPSEEEGRERLFFYFGTVAFIILLIYGMFSDLNYSIQEYANLQEIDIEFGDIGSFLFSGNTFGHQHLYHLLLTTIVHLFGLESRESVLLTGRAVSSVFAIGTLFLFKELLLSVPRMIPRTATCFVFILMPLNFFYFLQAEPYSMLLFMSVLNVRLFLLLGNNSITVTIAYTAATILGYLTHYFFLVIPASEALFVAYLWIFKKNSYRHFETSLLFVLAVLLITYRSILVMLSSSLIEYQQGYFETGARFFLKQVYAFWGLSQAVYGSAIDKTAFVYAALVFLLIYTVIKNRRYEITVFLATILLSELALFLAFNIVTTSRGYMTITLRHYVPITIPLALLYFAGCKKSKEPLRKQAIKILSAAALALYLATDISFLTSPFRFDGRGAGNYLAKIRDEEGVRHIAMMKWIENCGVNPWLIDGGRNELKGDYYLTDLVDNIANRLWPTWYQEASPYDEIRMRALWAKLKKEGDAIAIEKRRSDAENLNAYIARPGGLNKVLGKIKRRRIKIPDEVARIAATKRRNPEEQKEIEALATRLYLELLYPELRTKDNMLDIFVQKNRIRKIVKGKKKGEDFLFVVFKEEIAGMDYVDTKEQYEALRTLESMQGVEELFEKRFNNVEIYGFRKNR
jgi:hypothetical protein